MDSMMEWETVLVIILSYYINGWEFKQYEIKISTYKDNIAEEVMRIIKNKE